MCFHCLECLCICLDVFEWFLVFVCLWMVFASCWRWFFGLIGVCVFCLFLFVFDGDWLFVFVFVCVVLIVFDYVCLFVVCVCLCCNWFVYVSVCSGMFLIILFVFWVVVRDWLILFVSVCFIYFPLCVVYFGWLYLLFVCVWLLFCLI